MHGNISRVIQAFSSFNWYYYNQKHFIGNSINYYILYVRTGVHICVQFQSWELSVWLKLMYIYECTIIFLGWIWTQTYGLVHDLALVHARIHMAYKMDQQSCMQAKETAIIKCKAVPNQCMCRWLYIYKGEPGVHNWLGKERVGAGSAHANYWIWNIFPHRRVIIFRTPESIYS